MLREAETRSAGGTTVGEVCRSLGITEPTYHRWRKSCGGMQVSPAGKIKERACRAKKLVADQALDKAILEEAFKGATVPRATPSSSPSRQRGNVILCPSCLLRSGSSQIDTAPGIGSETMRLL
jgi:putative transposase